MKKLKITISVDELATLANIGSRRIYQLVQENKLPELNDGKLPRDESITALFKYFQRDPEELKREKLLLVKANRQLKEGELEVAQDKFIERTVARNSIIACSLDCKKFMRQEIEKSGPLNRRIKLEQLGVPAEICQSFNAFDVANEEAVINRITARFKSKYREAAKQVTE